MHSSPTLFCLSTIGLYGAQSGYTIVNFVMMYIIGSCLRLDGYVLEKKKSLFFFLLAVVFTSLMSFYEFSQTDDIMEVLAWYYCSPLIIFQAVMIFLFFKSFSIKSKIINELAKAAFLSFLIQIYFIPHMAIGFYAHKSLELLIIHLLVCSVFIYSFSYFVYRLYSFCFRPIQKKLDLFYVPYTVD